MYEILRKETLSDAIKLMVVSAPAVARKAQPGQFVIVRIDEYGERIPLTIADFDAEAGTITIILQEAGKSTLQMGGMQQGEALATFTGIRDLGLVGAVGLLTCLLASLHLIPLGWRMLASVKP